MCACYRVCELEEAQLPCGKPKVVPWRGCVCAHTCVHQLHLVPGTLARLIGSPSQPSVRRPLSHGKEVERGQGTRLALLRRTLRAPTWVTETLAKAQDRC